MNNEIEFYIPNNVDIREILKKERKGKRYIECQIDKYHWFLDTIYKQSILNKKYELGDFIPLQNKKLEEVLGSRYVHHIKTILPKHGIIECDHDFKEGIKSLGFRLTKDYQVRHYRILKDSNSTFIKSLQSRNITAIAEMDAITKYTYNQLVDLGIYAEEAAQHVEDWYTQNLTVENPVLLKKLYRKNKKRRKAERIAIKKGYNAHYPDLTYEQMLDLMRDSYLYQIRAINEKLWLPLRDDKSFRIHTYLTNSWSELRQFLYLKSNTDTQLVSLDCSNSQPFTLVKILLEHCKGIDLYDSPHTDVIDYIEFVTQGKLYHFMCGQLGITDSKEILKFKEKMFANVFYSSNKHGYFTKEAIAFREHFPTVYQVIMQEKRGCFKQLSIKMQRVETSAVIDIALTTLMEKYGESEWFSSIHDSIICSEVFEAEVRQLMLDAYNEVVGVFPHIKPAEKVNKLKPSVTVESSTTLPDNTPLNVLRKRFEEQFASKQYKDQIARKDCQEALKSSTGKKTNGLGIDW
ncbi:hypothetical protein TH61_00570 [Rufibacter sp. DG15C]|uniref:hypothetical protein n=1 Tax=Rufibacter sp. DG15C TaxID=1379909 RepID=UPI00078E9E51|nr:hypothetical protein [Rufibacter sp. DG15C]AMM49972.1 hypothetical protein TH61_00570 [Rufibacter sp. DG15C]